MNKKIKNFFLIFNKWLTLIFPETKRNFWFGAILFFVIFGLVFYSHPVFAQIPGFSCGFGDLACYIGNFVLSVMIKIAVLIFFGIPLLLSALFVGIMGLILGWIISPDFISLKFTQNPFVNIGLSITQNFANMGFIIFLVAIGLATALRIKEYQAKKTLPTLILIALLINFSPVFVGIIIDASNIVMNFFLSRVTGITGFVSFIDNASRSIWNLLFSSGFDVWANIAAAMQVIIMIVFNFFAGFIFILFSALFIMRYIMLWILVILSPIAFVSYILPITRRGRSLLSWRTWWQQLVAWSIIGIIAAFFLYLGFTMISMTSANLSMFVCQPGSPDCGPGGLGLMNNVLPYLIPLVLLWVAYKETKRTSAWFAKEIIEVPEKMSKAAIMAAATAVTAGTAGLAMKAGGALKKLPSAVGKLGQRIERFSREHPTAAKATVFPAVAGWASRRLRKPTEEEIGKRAYEIWERKGRPIQTKAEQERDWFEARRELTPRIRAIRLRERAREWAMKYPKVLKVARGARTAGGALKELLWEKKKEPTEEEIRRRAREIYEKRLAGREPGYTHAEIDAMIIRESRGRISPRTPEAERFMRNWDWEQARRQLRPKIPKKIPKLPAKRIIKKTRKIAWKGMQDAVRDFLKARGAVVPLKIEENIRKLEEIREKIDAEEEPTRDDVIDFPDLVAIIDRGELVSDYRDEVERLLREERRKAKAAKKKK